MNQAQGEIYDLGYQHYDGPRGGRSQAFQSLWVNSFRTTLGLGRGARAKILPALMSLFVIAPPTVFLVISAVVRVGQQASHADFYEALAILLLLFSAIMAPELLIPDRRNSVTTLYLVRPLTAFDYVLARWSAFLTIVLAVTLLSQVIVLAANLLLAPAPGEFLRENWLDIPRFILAGAIIAVFVTTIPMAVSAFTERRAYAAAFVIALFVITTPMSGLLTFEDCSPVRPLDASNSAVVEEEPLAVRAGPRRGGEAAFSVECRRFTGDYARWFVLLDVGRAPTHLGDLIFDDDESDDFAQLAAELPLAVPIAWYGLLVVGPGAVLLWRYWSIKI